MAVIDHDDVDVVLCGYHPGKVFVVGAAAPVFVVVTPVVWDVGVVVVNPKPVIIVNQPHYHWKGKGNGKGKWGKRGGIHVHF